jgi:hypothetical protein
LEIPHCVGDHQNRNDGRLLGRAPCKEATPPRQRARWTLGDGKRWEDRLSGFPLWRWRRRLEGPAWAWRPVPRMRHGGGAGRTHGFPSTGGTGLVSGSEGGTGPPGPTAHTNGAHHYGSAKIRTTVAGKLRFNVLESPFRGSGVVCSQGRVSRIDSGTLPANPIQGLDLQAPSRTYMM